MLRAMSLTLATGEDSKSLPPTVHPPSPLSMRPYRILNVDNEDASLANNDDVDLSSAARPQNQIEVRERVPAIGKRRSESTDPLCRSLAGCWDTLRQ
jgi:hypothetical protein